MESFDTDNMWFDETLTSDNIATNGVNGFNSIYMIFKYISIIFFVMASGFSISFVLVGFMLRNVAQEYNSRVRYCPDDNEDEDDDEETEEEFIVKYLELYNDLEEREIDKEELMSFKEQFIEEKSPREVIIMNYDSDLEGFTYYCNSKDIPYTFLETVARHYVVKYNCKKLLINTAVELDNAKIKFEEEKEKQEKEKEEKEKEEKEKEEKEKEEKEKEEKDKQSNYSVFARFKTYTDTNKSDNKNKPKENDDVIISPEQSNRYKYKGKLEDYENLFINKDKPDEFEHLDYSTFKKMANNDEKKTS